jgi:hypothetical protein
MEKVWGGIYFEGGYKELVAHGDKTWGGGVVEGGPTHTKEKAQE